MDTKDLQSKDIRNLISNTLHGGFTSKKKLNKRQEEFCKNNKEYTECKKFKCKECGNYHNTSNKKFYCPIKMREVKPKDKREGFKLKAEYCTDYNIGRKNGSPIIISENISQPTKYPKNSVLIVSELNEVKELGTITAIPVKEAGKLEEYV